MFNMFVAGWCTAMAFTSGFAGNYAEVGIFGCLALANLMFAFALS